MAQYRIDLLSICGVSGGYCIDAGFWSQPSFMLCTDLLRTSGSFTVVAAMPGGRLTAVVPPDAPEVAHELPLRCAALL